MDEILIDSMETEPSTFIMQDLPSRVTTSGSTGTGSAAKQALNTNGNNDHVVIMQSPEYNTVTFSSLTGRDGGGRGEKHPVPVHQHARRPHRDSGISNLIMMYSPDIPSAEHGSSFDVGGAKLAGYYTRIEAEENIKCIVSSAMFVVILVAIFIVAIYINPQM